MSVPVRTLFFAAYRDRLGVSELSIDLPSGSTVADLVNELRGRGAPIDMLPEKPAVAINQIYSFLDEPLTTGDEVAFIPPVAGG